MSETVKNNKAMIAYFMVIALDAISFGLVAPILAPLLAHPSVFFTSAQSVFSQYMLYGFLIMLYPLMYMFTAPLLGAMSDRFGRKPVLLYCSMFIALSFLSYACAFIWKNIWILLFARAVGGLSAGSQGVAQAAVIDFAKQNEKPRVISVIAIGMTMGLIIGPLVASLWSHTTTWLPFLIVTLLSLLSSYLLFFHVREFKVLTTKHSSWRKILQTPKVKKLLITFFIFELGWSLYYQALPLWLSLHWKLENRQLGLISSYIGMMLASCLFFGTRIGLRFTSLNHLIKYSFVFGMIALCLGVLKMPLTIFLLFSIPVVLAVALIYPGLISQLSELISAEQQGLLMGISDTLLALAFAVTGMLSSLLAYINNFLPFLVAALFWGVGGLYCIKRETVVLYKPVLQKI